MKPPMNPKPSRIILLIIILTCAVATLFWWLNGEHPQTQEQLILYGNVDIREVDLAFNGNERIALLFAVEGEQVTQGQLLAQLERQRLQAAADRAEALVQAQQQQLSRLETGSRPQEIRKAQADADAARAEAENADANYRRLRELQQKNLASTQQRDDAKTAATAAYALANATQETLKLLLEGPRQEDIAAARATLQARRAELVIAQRNFADASLYAPSNGIIQNRMLEPGDMASPQKPVYSLALTDPVWVRAYIEAPDLGKINPGMLAEIHTDSYPDKAYRGWVGYISPTAEFTPKSVETTRVRTDLVYQVRIYACNPNHELRLGMPATVSIALQQPPSAVTPDNPPCDKDKAP